MPSSRKIQFNVSVEPQLKIDFKKLCERQNVSLASAIQDLMSDCIDADTLPTKISPRSELTIHFADRELETLKTLANNYTELLNKFNGLQKRVSRLEHELQKAWGFEHSNLWLQEYSDS